MRDVLFENFNSATTSRTTYRVEDLALRLIEKRLKDSPKPKSNVVKFPMGLFFIRGDREGEGANIANQVRASYKYWHEDSAHDFDLIFPGWYKTGSTIKFSRRNFLRYRNQLHKACTWRYSGEADLLLLNLVYIIGHEDGGFSFDEVINLPVERMLREKIVGSVDGLMSEIVSAARSTSKNAGVWEISDQVGYLRGRKALWKTLKKLALRGFADAANLVEPFSVKDIRLVK